MTMQANQPIGIFDSGVGGLTVAHALHSLLPHDDVLYLGDSARLPYGTKCPASVEGYARHAVGWLIERGIKLLVVACNTASALALDDLCVQLAPIPVIGVVEPGARAAVEASVNGRHLVLATESTVRVQAYTAAIQQLDAAAQVEELACSVFVALAEEGWGDTSVARETAGRYLRFLKLMPPAERPDCAILGCTHFPLLRSAIGDALGADITIVDSATTTATAVQSALKGLSLLAPESGHGDLRLSATDGADRFARIGSAFLGKKFSPADIELTDIHPADAPVP